MTAVSVLNVTHAVIDLIATSGEESFDCADFTRALDAHRAAQPWPPRWLVELTPGVCEPALDQLVADGVLVEHPLDLPDDVLAANPGRTFRSWQFTIVAAPR